MEPTYRDNPGSYRTYLTRSGSYVADPNWAIGGKFDRPSQRDNSPTVFSDSNIRENVIPGLNARANDLLGERPKFYRTQSGGYVNTKFADPSLQGSQTYTEDQIMGNTSGAVSGADATDNSGQQNGGENEYDTLFKNIMGSNAYKTGAAAIEQSPESIQEKALIDQMRTMADANSAAQLAVITKQYQQRQDLLKQVQSEEGQGLKHQLMLAGSRYSPGSTGSVMTLKEKNNLRELNALEDQGEAAKQDIKNAKLNQDFQLMEKEIGRLEKIRTQKAGLANKMQETMIQNNKELRERVQKTKDELEKTRTDILKSAAGAPREVLDAISKAANVADMVNAAGDYASKATGIVGEYQFYKKDAEARGLTPLNFDEYQTRDANRKIKIASAASSAGSDLTSKEQTIFNHMVDKFNASPAIKALDRASQLKGIVDEIKKNPGAASSQLNLIYAYIKGLDTDSAVREGEIDLVKGIQSYLGKFGTTLEKITEGKTVSNSTALEMARGAENLISTIEQTAKRKEAVFKAQAKQNGSNVYDAWDGFSSSARDAYSDIVTDQDINKVEEEAKNKVISYGTRIPKDQVFIKNKMSQPDQKLGRPWTYSEVLQYLQATGKLK